MINPNWKAMGIMAGGCINNYDEILDGIRGDIITSSKTFTGVNEPHKLDVGDLYKESMLSMLYIAKDKIQAEIDNLARLSND